jgi:S1-C subfamily serine protease
MGTEKISDDIEETAQKPPAKGCPNNFKPWVLALVVMVIITLAWSVYEAQQRGRGIGRFFGGRGEGEQTALETATPAPAKALQSSYHNIIDGVKPAVISIDAVVPDPNANAADPVAKYARIGSGVIIDPRGYVLSSLHVVDGASSLKATVYGPAGAMEYPIKVVKGDHINDLVLLRIQGDGPLSHASLGDSNSVRTGDVVLSIGSPFGFEQSVTSGIISSRNRTINVNGMVYENLIQTDSSINKGSCGGPLLNAKGNVIGINTAIYSPSGVYSGISFAVPINLSLDLIGGVVDFQNEPPPVTNGQLAAWRVNARQIGNAYRLRDGQVITPPHNFRGVCLDCHPQLRSQSFTLQPGQGLVPGSTAPGQAAWGNRAYPYGMRRNAGPWCPVVGPNNLTLGITVMDVDDVIANQNNMLRPEGVLVNSVIPGTPADAAGLQRGDVILRIDGRKIQDINSFAQFLEGRSGTGFDLVMLRFGARRTATVKLQQGGGIQAAAATPIKQPAEFAWLGADIGPLTTGKPGVSVVEVEGILGAAGVKAGDIIKAVNGTAVTDLNSFIALATKVDLKKGCLLDILRAGDPIFITVKG